MYGVIKMAESEKFLIALDETDASLKAVQYVGRMTRTISGISICLLHIYPEPPPDFFQKEGNLEAYKACREIRAEKMFVKAEKILMNAEIPLEAVSRDVHMAEGKTISEAVLEVQKKGEFGTVVTGKRGVSKAEEFLFGSISNTLARSSQGFVAWIVG